MSSPPLERPTSPTRRRLTAGVLAAAGAAVLGACRGDDASVLAEADAGPSSGPQQATPASGSGGPGGSGSSGGASVTTTTLPAPGAWPPLSTDRAVHTANRLSFGATPTLLADVRAVGPVAWVQAQLDPSQHPDPPALQAALDALPSLTKSAGELAAFLGGADQQAPTAVALETVAATIARQRWSGAQLYELMVEFWTNHFAMNLFEGPLRLLKPIDDREVVRPHALGRFADLLAASAQSPAMLTSLDNARSRVGAINENYGRELLELHTVGIGGGYTEADVVAAANTLTGFTVVRGQASFVFDARRHDTSPQRVMGWRTPVGGDGLAAGLDLLDYLAHHRATAEHLATKLLVRFVSDTPDAAYVAHLADVYLAQDTAIGPVLEAMVTDERFFTTATAKFRRPHELVVAALRALDAELDVAELTRGRRGRAGTMQAALRALGQVPMAWPSPDGFPDVAVAWLNAGSLLTRWNALSDLAANALSGVAVQLDRLDDGARTAGAYLDGVALRVLGEPADDATRFAVLDALGLGENDALPADGSHRALTFALLLSSPRFQYR